MITPHWSLNPTPLAPTIGGMTTALRKWREARGLTQAELGRRVVPPTSQQQIDKLEKAERQLTVDWLRRLSSALDCDPSDLLDPAGPRTVPIYGYAGGPDVVEWLGEGGGEAVAAPPGIYDGFAVRVRGNHYAPRYFDGAVLFCRRVNGASGKDLVGGDALIRLKDNRTVLRRVERAGKGGALTLTSYNLAMPLMIDVTPQWIAPVEWVKPRG